MELDKEFIENFKNNEIFKRLIKILKIENNFELINQILNILKYEQIPKNKILFKENQKNNLKLYIIMEGKVGITKYLKKEDVFDKKIIQIDNLYIGHFLRYLNKGDIFGELALSSNENKRTASVYTIENCKFLTLNKIDFEKTLKIFYSKEYNNKKKLFISTFNLKLSNHLLDMLIYMCKKEKYTHGKLIISENDLFNKFYVIKKGILEFYKKNKLLKNYYKNLYLKQLTNNQIFGEEIFFENNPKSNYNIQVKSAKVVLYSLNKKQINEYPEIKFFFKYFCNKIIKIRKEFMDKKENKLKNKLKTIFDKSIKTKNEYMDNKNNKKLNIFLNKDKKYILNKKKLRKNCLNKIILFKGKRKTKVNKMENYLTHNNSLNKISFLNNHELKKYILIKKKNNSINLKHVIKKNNNYINIIRSQNNLSHN